MELCVVVVDGLIELVVSVLDSVTVVPGGNVPMELCVVVVDGLIELVVSVLGSVTVVVGEFVLVRIDDV
jgi:hypothetical protein